MITMRLWSGLAITAVAMHLVAASGGLQVGYPSSNLVQCSLAQLQWSGSIGQSNVVVMDASGGTVKSFDAQPDNTFSLTWYPIDAKAGEQVYVKVTDATGNTASSPMLTIDPSNDKSCLSAVTNPLLPSFTLFSGPPLPVTSTTIFTTSSGSIMTTITTIVNPPSSSSSSGLTSPSTLQSSSLSSSVVASPTSAPLSSTSSSSLPSSSSAGSPDDAAPSPVSLNSILLLFGALIPAVLVHSLS